MVSSLVMTTTSSLAAAVAVVAVDVIRAPVSSARVVAAGVAVNLPSPMTTSPLYE